MTTNVTKTILSAVLGLAIFAGAGAAFESATSATPQMGPSVRFTSMEPDSHGCHKAVFGEKGRRYYLYRDRYLVAEARWLYCLGKIDHLPTWAR